MGDKVARPPDYPAYLTNCDSLYDWGGQWKRRAYQYQALVQQAVDAAGYKAAAPISMDEFWKEYHDRRVKFLAAAAEAGIRPKEPR